MARRSPSQRWFPFLSVLDSDEGIEMFVSSMTEGSAVVVVLRTVLKSHACDVI